MQRITTSRRAGMILALLILPLALATTAPAQNHRLQPGDLHYLGGFLLPELDNENSWLYSGNGLAYYPGGDAGGEGDGFPGSLIGTGNDLYINIGEVSIPAPVNSPGKNPDELNTARTLQGLTDILGPLTDAYWEQPRVGLCWLPAQSGQDRDKIHYTFGQHLQDTAFEPCLGWFNPDLSNPQTTGPWVFGGFTGYVTNDYLTRIPTAWADAHVGGRYLGAGRAREGPWAGRGPALFACAPWQEGSPPARGSALQNITPLLMYGTQPEGSPELGLDPAWIMNNYSDSDRFRAVSWLTAGDRAAVVFAGTKAMGNSWYGFADGTVWDYNCAETNSCPEVPPFPYDNRGFWAEDLQAQLIFYDPEDLAQVAAGAIPTWQPQPYAVMDLSPYLFDSVWNEEDLAIYRRDFVGAITFDADRRLLYVTEQLAMADGRSVIHVFRVGD